MMHHESRGPKCVSPTLAAVSPETAYLLIPQGTAMSSPLQVLGLMQVAWKGSPGCRVGDLGVRL